MRYNFLVECISYCSLIIDSKELYLLIKVISYVDKESSKDLSESAVLDGSIDEVHTGVIALEMNDENISIIAFFPFDDIA